MLLTAGAVATLLLLTAAAVSDLWRRTIPNSIPIAIAVAYGLVATGGGAVQPGSDGLVAAAVLATGAGLFALGWIGGGDVKLLAAVALWAGPAAVLELATLTALAGGIIGLTVAGGHWARRRLAQADGPAVSLPPPTVPYGVAIALAGAVIVLDHL